MCTNPFISEVSVCVEAFPWIFVSNAIEEQTNIGDKKWTRLAEYLFTEVFQKLGICHRLYFIKLCKKWMLYYINKHFTNVNQEGVLRYQNKTKQFSMQWKEVPYRCHVTGSWPLTPKRQQWQVHSSHFAEMPTCLHLGIWLGSPDSWLDSPMISINR